MTNGNKSDDAYKTIGEITRDLNLINKNTGNLQTHTLRYWEKEFKQLRPRIMAGKRRYYSKKDIQILKLIKFLLKEKGYTVNGVKKILDNTNLDTLDANVDLSVYKPVLDTSKNLKTKEGDQGISPDYIFQWLMKFIIYLYCDWFDPFVYQPCWNIFHYYCAFTMPWPDRKIYVNPPFSKGWLAIRKCLVEFYRGRNIVLLLPEQSIISNRFF